MTKSKGNVVDPLEIIEQYGTDAVRFTLAVMTGAGSDIVFSTDRMIGYRAFANKIWNAARFLLINLPENAAPASRAEIHRLAARQSFSAVNRWILHRLNVVVGKVNGDLEKFRFDESSNALYHFFWHELCDWYLELSKPVLSSKSGEDYDQTIKTMIYTLDISLRALHPLMPFITEELWQRLPHEGESVTVAAYPVADSNLEDPAADREMNQLIDFVTAVRSVRSENHVDPGRRFPLEVVASSDGPDLLARYKPAILALAKLTEIRVVDAFGGDDSCLRGFSRLGEFSLISETSISAGAEAERLRKEMAKLREELERHARKLSNHDFLRKAPQDVIDSAKVRQAELSGRLEKVSAELRRLEGR